MNTFDEGSYSAVVCIDWADSKHDYCLQDEEGRREFGQIKHGAESIEEWVLGLQARFGGMIAIAVELARGPLVYALQKYDFITLFPIHPAMLAKYRETFCSSGAKDDPTDAEIGLDLVVRHPDRFKPLRPQSVEMRELGLLVEQRRQFVDDKVKASNRLTSCLKKYYPQALEWFAEHDTVLFCDFLSQWPTQLQAKRARRSTLERFFKAHRSARKDVMERRIEAIRHSVPLTEDPAVIEAHRMQALALVEQLRVALKAIKQYDDAIAELAQSHADFELFSSFPAAGAVMGPRLMTALGEQRERFSSADEVQMCAAIAPVTIRSGNTTRVQWRYQGSRFMRQTFVEWAALTTRYSYWAANYYEAQRAKGKSHNAAVRALAFKWIRIIYRCWAERKPYDEATYLRALQNRGSPLVAAA